MGALLAEDLRFELAILATVQGLYQKLLRDTLGGDVPIPTGLDDDALRHSDRELPNYAFAHVSLAAPAGYGDHAGHAAPGAHSRD